MKRKCKEVNGKRVQYHRWIVEEFLGRKLTSNEVVHHKDGDEFNNDISNLQIMTLEEHTSLHSIGRSVNGGKGKPHYERLSWIKIREILSLWDSGIKNYSKISKRLKISDNCVRKYILENRTHTPTLRMEIKK